MKLKSKLYKAATPYDASVSTPALVPRPLCDFQGEIRESSKNAIPLTLRLNAINWSLREVVARCRDDAVSPYLAHFFRATSQAERGAQVKPNTLTMNFSKARNIAKIDWGDGTPATFHEQCSLA